MSISQIKDNGKLSPCVIIDTFEGMVCQCGNTTNLRPLWQLIRMWQVDKETINKENSLQHLGVCQTHFMFGNYMHPKEKKNFFFINIK